MKKRLFAAALSLGMMLTQIGVSPVIAEQIEETDENIIEIAEEESGEQVTDEETEADENGVPELKDNESTVNVPIQTDPKETEQVGCIDDFVPETDELTDQAALSIDNIKNADESEQPDVRDIELNIPLTNIEFVSEIVLLRFVTVTDGIYHFSSYDYKGGNIYFELLDADGKLVFGIQDHSRTDRQDMHANLAGDQTYFVALFENEIYDDSLTCSFLIEKVENDNFDRVNISGNSKVSIGVNSFSYDGEEKNPVPTLKYNDTEDQENLYGEYTLVNGKDYVIQGYSNNVAVGTAKVFIVGIGLFTGRVEKSFDIRKPSGGYLDITISSSMSTSYSPTSSVSGIYVTNSDKIEYDYVLSKNGSTIRSGKNASTISLSGVSSGTCTLRITEYNFRMVARMVDGSYVYVRERTTAAYSKSLSISLPASSDSPTKIYINSIMPGMTYISDDEIILGVITSPAGGDLNGLEWYGLDQIQDGVISLSSLGNFKGKRYITASLDDKYRAYWCIDTTGDSVIVEPLDTSTVLPESISLNAERLNLFENDTYHLKAILSPESATERDILWNSNYPEIASVDEDGNVNAISCGSAIITAKTVTGLTAKCEVTVAPRIYVESISLSDSEIGISIGETKRLEATVYPVNATNKNIIWYSADEDIAHVDSEGNITGKGKGQTKITVVTQDGNYSDECIVSVKQKVTGIELSADSVMLKANHSISLNCIIYPQNADDRNVTWSSSNPSVASVDTNGRVIGRTQGIAYITAKTEDGEYTAECKITVLFTDVEDENMFCFYPVYWAVEHGITVGAGGYGKFSPNATCTREQIVTFLWRLMGEPEPRTTSHFTDVSKYAWYYKPITWAYENGITTGLNDGTGRFGVGSPCTREQCVTFLYRAAGSPYVYIHADFSDVTPDKYYYHSISWAAYNGITVGLNDGTGRFGVGQRCTRAMIVTFLYRYTA